MKVWVGDAHAHEDCTIEEQRSVIYSLCGKVFHAKDIQRDMFLVYGGKCLSHKTVHKWVEIFSQELPKIANDGRRGVEVAETTIEIFPCCGLRRDGRSVSVLLKGMSRNKCFFFSRFKYHMFYVSYPFVTYLLTLSCM
jgi:hypothetical protein